jgi:GAF domain-containing protein
LVCSLLDSEAILLHVCRPNLRPALAYSKIAETIQLCITASSLAALRLKEAVAITDLQNDSAWKNSKLLPFNFSLSVPLIGDQGEPFGVLELFRRQNAYDSTSQMLGGQVASIIRPSFLKSLFEGEDVLLCSTELDSSPKDQIIQLAELLNNLRSSISRVVACETCCVYFVNPFNNTAITQKSQFSDSLEVLLEPDTLLGHTYQSLRVVHLPQDTVPPLKDLQMYAECSVVCIPVLSSQDRRDCRALILMTRQDGFLPTEVKVLMRLAGHLSGLLDQDYTDKVPILKLSNSTASFHDEESSLMNLSRETSMSVNLLNNLIGVVEVSPKRLQEVRPVILSIASAKDSPLKQLSQNLRRIVPCQHAKLYLVDETKSNLIDVVTESLVKISGLTKTAILSKQSVVVNGAASRRPNFDRYCDSLGLEQTTESYLCVVIIDFFNHVLGVMVFVNSPVYFSDEDIKLAEFVSLVPRELARYEDTQLRNWASLVKAERKHKSLQHWFKQVTVVSSNTQRKAAFAKDILLALNSNPDAKTLLRHALLVVGAMTNAEDASIIFRQSEVYTEYTKEGSFRTSRTPEHLIKEVQDNRQILTLETGADYANMLLIPLRFNDRATGVLKVVNKKDESTSLFSVFSLQDEKVLVGVSHYIGEAVLALSQDKEVNLEPLYLKVKEMASGLNTFTLLSVIRTAAQNLLNCDRGTVFTREEDFLVVKAQALEQEIPLNYKVPVGSGIVGYVVQTGATEIIPDVYLDPRFNNEMDLRTGYRTRSVLCMPVKDSEGRVIAALQMINKRQGVFTTEDAELLELFSEQVGSVLQSTSLFNQTLEESCKLYNIINSLGSNILVLDSQGRLILSNKPIEGLFGIAEKLARKSHFTVWLRDNQNLVQDVTQVLEQPTKKIERQSQRLVSRQLLRSVSSIEVLRPPNKGAGKTYNYTVQGLTDLFSKKHSGAVLIFEDSSEFEALKTKFAKMEIKIKDLTTPVSIETSLQKCINQLIGVYKTLDTSNTMRFAAHNVESLGDTPQEVISEVIESLKAGNLYSPQLIFNGGLGDLNTDLRALRDYLTADLIEPRRPSTDLTSNARRASDSGQPLELTELRNWNLNTLEVQNFTCLIIDMLDDFELFAHFRLDRSYFSNFIGAIHELCEIRKNPFHNFTHCFTVMHTTYMLLVTTPAKACFGPSEILALLVAAVVHDVDHTGRANSFEVNKGSHLALLYHDKSVLEQHHAAVAFFTMQRTDCNIFGNLDQETRKRVRAIMIASILDTDMAAHFRILPEMKSRFADLAESPYGSRETDTKAFAGFLLHCADLGHPAKEYSMCISWSQLVCQEFSAQHLEEVELGLPVTEFMKDLDKPTVYYKNEINFLKFVVLPLWQCSVGWLGSSVTHCVENVEGNMAMMQRKLSEMQEAAEAESK